MKGVIKMLDLQGMVQELEDMVQEGVLAALESGERQLIISQASQEVVEIVGYMGYQYHYDVEDGDLVVHW